MSRDPVRTCSGCRSKRPQGDLLRVARSPGGGVTVDPLGPDARPRGRSAGRGAYVCPRETCIERALSSGSLRRALRYDGELPPGLRRELLRTAEKEKV